MIFNGTRRTPPDAEFKSSRIRRAAKENLGEGICALFLKQAWAEMRVTARRVYFRRNRNAEAVRAYCAMTPKEFEAINARQKWSNWRTIPRNLLGRLPTAPCRAVDLCSGIGHSTQVLAFYLPPGSEILGLEYNPEFVKTAAAGHYRDASGGSARVVFRAQSVLETFRDARGERMPDSSVDLVNSCGSLGIHFTEAEIGLLTVEISRVLRKGGLATVDSGAQGVAGPQMKRIFERRGFVVLNSAKSCCLDRFVQICFRKS